MVSNPGFHAAATKFPCQFPVYSGGLNYELARLFSTRCAIYSAWYLHLINPRTTKKDGEYYVVAWCFRFMAEQGKKNSLVRKEVFHLESLLLVG